jgi:decaprenyl-phosphate phosphoribosyltransferase
MLAIASGFVLRAAAGGAAAHIHLSRSFLLVAGCGAVFLVAGKRYAELRDGFAPSIARSTLRRYSSAALRGALVVSATCAVAAYAVWALLGPGHGLWHLLSIAPLSLGLARYGALLARGEGQSPEETVLGDRALLALGAVWAGLFLAGVYAGD